jgi:hypothetical protein
MEYVPLIKQLELFYDNPVKFEEVVQKIKSRVHRGKYNRSELLNVWRKLCQGLENSACETNIKCLLDHGIEFLNYQHDNEPMLYLLKNGSVQLVDTVLATFPVKKLIGFHHEHEPKLSLSQDLNLQCPVMTCLELLMKSKGEEAVDYKNKMDIFLKYTSLQFTLKYVSNHTLYYTTPLAYMIVNHQPVMAEYIKLHGGKLEYKLDEPYTNQFFHAEAVQSTLLDYFEKTNKPAYELLVKQTRTFKNRKGTKVTLKNIQKRNDVNSKEVNLDEVNTKEVNLNNVNTTETNMNKIKERIRMNKEKRNLLSEPVTRKNQLVNVNIQQVNVKNQPVNVKQKSKTKKSKPTRGPYVVVGGVGGSGTRLIASILATLGLNIGTDLNEAYDNLSFTLLYKHLNTLNMDQKRFDQSYRILTHSILGTRDSLTEQENRLLEELSEKGRPGHPHSWLKERAENIQSINEKGPLENPYLKELPNIQQKPLAGKWGWKEPNSHMIMNRLNKKTKFIMVVRNGLDMAFSSNQNQLRLWGPSILPKEMKRFDKQGHILYTPRVSMKYWTLVHKKILQESKVFGDNFLMVNFDDMCVNPDKWLKILCDFLKIDSSVIPEIRPLVVYQSEGIGRFKKHSLSQFAESDVLFAKKLGFDTEPN